MDYVFVYILVYFILFITPVIKGDYGANDGTADADEGTYFTQGVRRLNEMWDPRLSPRSYYVIVERGIRKEARYEGKLAKIELPPRVPL